MYYGNVTISKDLQEEKNLFLDQPDYSTKNVDALLKLWKDVTFQSSKISFY